MGHALKLRRLSHAIVFALVSTENKKIHTDLDLSVGLYDANWKYIDVCSYYQLKVVNSNKDVASSSGDLRDALGLMVLQNMLIYIFSELIRWEYDML